MTIQNVKYTESGAISASIDGVSYFIPDNATNRYRRLLAEWEAQGNTIAPYVAPPDSAEITRIKNFKADTTYADIITRMQGAPNVAAITTWWNGLTAAQKSNITLQMLIVMITEHSGG